MTGFKPFDQFESSVNLKRSKTFTVFMYYIYMFESRLISRKCLYPFEKAELVSGIAESKYGNRKASTVNKGIDKMWKKVIFVYIDNPEEEEDEE